LIIDVLDEICRRHAFEIGAAARTMPRGRHRIEAVLDALWAVFKGPVYVASLELYVAGRTDPDLRQRILTFEAETSESIRDVILESVEPSDPETVRLQADVILNTLRGLALLHTTGTDPESIESIWAQARDNAAKELLGCAILPTTDRKLSGQHSDQRNPV
jgi:hypothetical protein